MDGHLGGEGFFERVKSEGAEFLLHHDIAGLSHGIAKWEVNEDEPGNPGVLDDVAGGSDDDRWDSVCFEMTCNQADRLVTDRSKRNEDHRIDIVLAYQVE